MDRDRIISRLRESRPELEAGGIAHLYLFGSYARGEAREDSDIDLFFDPRDPDFTLLDYAGIVQMARDVLPFPTDLYHRESLRPRIRARAEADAVRVF